MTFCVLALSAPVETGDIVLAPAPRRILHAITREEFLRCMAETEGRRGRKFSRFDSATREYTNISVLPDSVQYFYSAEPVE